MRLLCPNCTEPLNVTHRLGVEVDSCPQCRGVWLDRGELDKLLARADDDDRGYRRSDDRDRYRDDDDDYRRKKKGGLLKELFDF